MGLVSLNMFKKTAEGVNEVRREENLVGSYSSLQIESLREISTLMLFSRGDYS